jgi:hypothetical protein
MRKRKPQWNSIAVIEELQVRYENTYALTEQMEREGADMKGRKAVR